jgi:hypothetical protein
MEFTFESKWNLFYHAVDDKSFELDSFKLIYTIGCLDDIFKLIETIPTFQSGMFFLIREGISPVLESTKGGMWTYRVSKKVIDDIFEKIMYLITTNSLTKDPKSAIDIYGISISPKLSNCVIKFLTTNCEERNPSLKFVDIPGIKHEDALFRNNSDPPPSFKPHKYTNSRGRGGRGGRGGHRGHRHKKHYGGSRKPTSYDGDFSRN